ncbi:membrane protein [Arsenicicoccus sp. oral taxon 190]|nr:membrane protein [Arsenicicoccus sp. oral taxon 190]
MLDRWGAARRRWSAYRARQRATLTESYRLEVPPGEVPAGDVPAGAEPAGTADPVGPAGPGAPEATPPGEQPSRAPGVPLNRQSPFAIGFVGALGVLTAVTLWNAIGTLSLTFTLLTVALFLTLALDPIVQRLIRGGMSRGPAVAFVMFGALVVFALLAWLVVPPVAEQAGALVQNAPSYVNELLQQRWVQDLDKNYNLTAQIQKQVNDRLTDQGFLSTVAGGIIGAGQAVGSGIFQTFTVLILTLYFLASLPTTKKAAYAVVPASRRARVVYLSEEMMRRVGSYAIGQVGVAAINGLLSWVAMRFLGVPYAEVLAVSVAFLGLIPMVGATLGGALVTLAGLLQSTQTGIVLLVYYIVYQQVENYVIVPRIMQRTVAVPGAVTVVAALAGGTMLGVLGALLAIPTAAALLLLYEEVLVPRQRRL